LVFGQNRYNRRPRTGQTGIQKKRGSQRQEQERHLLEELQDRTARTFNIKGKGRVKTLEKAKQSSQAEQPGRAAR
jgi:hypothetical protein